MPSVHRTLFCQVMMCGGSGSCVVRALHGGGVAYSKGAGPARLAHGGVKVHVGSVNASLHHPLPGGSAGVQS